MIEYLFLCLCVLSKFRSCNAIDIDCNDLSEQSEDIFFENGDEIFLNKFDRAMPIEILNSMQLMKANRSSYWVSTYFEPYPVNHQNYYEHNYSEFIIRTYNREAMEHINTGHLIIVL